MSLDNLDKIDWFAVDPDRGLVELAIADDRDWLTPELHLASLQDKINAYIGAIEEGQIAELAAVKAPGSKRSRDWSVRIVVYFRYAVPEGDPKRFLLYAKKIARDAGVAFACKVAGTTTEWEEVAL